MSWLGKQPSPIVVSGQQLADKTVSPAKLSLGAPSWSAGGLLTPGAGIDLSATGQIKFPATQNPSSDANTLDDYEEGTWTPTFTGSGTNPNVTVSSTGRYIKIGRLVWVGLSITTNTVTSVGSGNLFISGLPFTSDNSLQETGVTIGNMAYWSTFPVLAAVLINDTKIELLKANNSNSQCSDLNPSGESNYFRAQAVYLASN